VAVRADKWHYTHAACATGNFPPSISRREDIIFLTQLGAFSSKSALFAASALSSPIAPRGYRA
jgi:hypothetical protein